MNLEKKVFVSKRIAFQVSEQKWTYLMKILKIQNAEKKQAQHPLRIFPACYIGVKLANIQSWTREKTSFERQETKPPLNL